MRCDRLRLPLHVDGSPGFDVEERVHEPVGIVSDLHRAGLGRLLHPSRDVQGVAHRRVLDTEVRADLTDDDRARVDADADVQVEITIGSDLLSKRIHPLDDLESRRDGALRVILVGDGRTEEREDRIAHQPSERALIPIDRRDQVLEHLVHDLGPLFGIEPLGHGRRADDVAEEHRQDASFSIHRPTDPGCLELGDQPPREVGLESRSVLGGRVPTQGDPAVQTEPRCVRVHRRAFEAQHLPTIDPRFREAGFVGAFECDTDRKG